jgi:hypothetical protein
MLSRTTSFRAVGAVCVLAAFSGVAAGAEGEPLSAIDWLSDSIALPDVGPSDAAPIPETAPPPKITVAPLDTAVPDRAGLIDARRLGIDPGLWGRSAAGDLAQMIAALPETEGATPALRRFLHDLLVTRLDPPIDAVGNDSLFLARIDRLLDMGHLASADQLIDAAGAPEPRRFRRAFDIALLTGTEPDSCAVIEATPDISPTYPARIFCLARNGEWEVAALTLGTAEALNILTPEEDQLLLHFLDPELFESEPVPPVPHVLSPLIFRLYEAIGERLSTEHLPVAFATADLTQTVGWKTRLRATERLTAAGAMSVERLLAVYGERAPAASGGIWDRVGAVQTLRDTLRSGDAEGVSEALPRAWSAAREAGYAHALAGWIAPRLEGVALGREAVHVAFEVVLMAERPDLARDFAGASREDQFLLSVASGQPGPVQPSDPLGRAVRRGLSALGPGERFQALLDDDRPGEALLKAMSLLMDGAAGNPDATADALALLRVLGLEQLARQVAIELILQDGSA